LRNQTQKRFYIRDERRDARGETGGMREERNRRDDRDLIRSTKKKG
jgi:hypothetical protein